MRKNLILTISVGDNYKKISELTHPLIKAYADKIDADFYVVNENTCTSPHWEKFNYIYNLLNKYERILYVDTDILIRNDCPNLFDIVPILDIGLFNELPYTSQRYLSLIESCKEYGITLKNWNGRYYNTGVMVVSRCHKFLFKKPEKELFNFYEQGYFNANLAKELDKVGNELTIFELPYKFNRMTCMDQFTGEERFASYLIHYAGYPSLDFVLELIKKDIKKWSDDTPKFEYKQHVLVNVQGGLGDQISVEPSLRFLKKYVYPNADVKVLTHFPRIFSHLKGLMEIYSHGELKGDKDIPFYQICSLPGPETEMWKYVSNLLCHTIDFSSMALMRRTLPNKDKQIKLEIKEEDIKEVESILGKIDLSELILVHAGKHWESKTFPIEWWQGIVDGLNKNGMKVCLIGSDEKTRGVLPLELRNGMVDTRNLLTLGGLIYLISKAKVLLSNDSAPIHIAGAFDNWICLIPTCKHSDYILPFRNGIQEYKTKVMCKRQMSFDYDSRPSSINGVLADKVPTKFEDYLPEISNVISEISMIKE